MVLYQAINTYQLLVSILHANKVHADDKRVLLLPSFIVRSIPQYEELVKNGLFDEILIFNYSKFNAKDRAFVMANLEKDFDALFETDKIEDFTEIYIGAAQYYLSVYLVLKDKNFSIIEDGAGLLSRHHLLEETFRNQHVLNVELLEEFEILQLNNPHIIRKLCLMDSQEPDFYDELAEDFDIERELFCLDDVTRKKILDFWKCPSYDDSFEDGVLLMTQNFANLNQMGYDDQVWIYQTLLDLFCKEDKVIIKPHPNDIMPYEMFATPNVSIMRYKFPSELLPFVFEKQPRTIYNVSSTGIRLIEKCFDKSVTLGLDYEKTFKKAIAYYGAAKMVEKMGLSFEFVGECDYIVNNFKLKEPSNPVGKAIITDIELDNLDDYSDYDCIIFVDRYDELFFDEKKIECDLIVKAIEKTPEREAYRVADLETEFLYIICQNKEMRKSIMEFKYSEKLENMGIGIEIKEDDDLLQYTKLLKGYNRALEKRLTYYINLVEEQENEDSSNHTI